MLIKKADWLDEYSTTETLSFLKGLAFQHAKHGGSHGQKIISLLEKEDYRSLCEYNLDLSAPWDVFQLLNCRQALGFFTKLEALDIGIDKEARAFQKFEAAEKMCSTSNDLFRQYAGGTVNLRARDVRLLEAVRRKIASVLGRCPEISELNLSFGPGSTTAVKKPLACPAMKMAARPSCSDDLYASGLLPSLLRELPHYTAEHSGETYVTADPSDDAGDYIYAASMCEVELTPARLEFVPKNASTFRTITVEPTLNSLLQAGIRKWMTRRLSHAGINLADQSINANYAKEGSITGDLATLDLASASDTISSSLVKLLLPASWYRLLNAARTSVVTYRDREFALEKFSAMGNATTFPLETLIFWAIAKTCSQPWETVSVYGDDIICARESAKQVIYGLNMCGFEVSPTKSFVSGPFRESCGSDYYHGINVRPFYQKQLVSGRTLFLLHNYYIRSGQFDLADYVADHIHPSLKIYGPDGYGDGHLLGDWSPRKPASLLAKGYAGGTFETFSLVGKKVRPPFSGDYISPLYAVYTRAEIDLLGVYKTYRDPAGVLPDYVERIPVANLDSNPVQFDKGGFPVWDVPGACGYKRHKIYTFATY